MRTGGLLGVALAIGPYGVAAGPDPNGIEQWVRDQGGSVRPSASGEVVEIDLSRTWVTDVDLERLRGLNSLTVLKLAQTHVSDSALRVVASLARLRSLDLFFCEHVTDAGASVLRDAAGLERLNVRGTKIGDSGLKFLTELERLKSLDVGITEVSDSSVELLEALPALEDLAIGGNRIGEAGIGGLRALKRLKALDLSGAQVTDSGVWAVGITDLNLSEIAAMQGLESLNLAAPSQEYVLAISSGVPRLRGGIRVTDLGAPYLARLTALRKLNLTRSSVTAKGIESLQPLQSLQELVLSHVASLGTNAGAALRGLPALRVLDLSHSKFDDAGLAALADHPALRRIVLAGTQVSAEAVERFLAAGEGRVAIR